MAHRREGLFLLALLSLLVLVTCGGDAPGDAGGARQLPGPAACVAGELTRPDGSCQPAGLPPDMACPPGERVLPDGGCQPAGVPPEACAAGRFVPDGRGGCAPILPDEVCPAGQMAVPGERACREVSPCGEGPWAAAMPVEATTQHVDQGYAGGDSDGSRERPWQTVGQGVRAASPGAIVAVAAGRYAEDVVVSGKPVRLWGRCPARTAVVGLDSRSEAVILVRAGASGSEVRGLAVTGPNSGIAVQGARSVVLEEVWVHEAGLVGVVMTDRAGVTLRGALVEANHDIGVLVGGAEATVEATVVRATQPNGDGQYGRGIDVDPNPATGERGTLSLTASLIEANHDMGVFVAGSDATVEATVVRATQPNGAGKSGQGIGVQANLETGERGTLSLTASLIEANHEIGVFVGSADATVEATVVRATQPDGAGKSGRGIDVEPNPATGERGTLSLTASLIEENHEVGVFVAGADATVEATVVRATQPNGAGKLGRGIGVEPNPATGERGTLSLTASLIEANHEVGVFVESSDATVEATVVRATQPDGAGQGGRGINVQANLATGERGSLSLTASLIEANHEVGVFVWGSDATVEATVVRATQPDGAGPYGRGIDVEPNPATGERGTLSLTASLIEENHEVGVFVAGADATVEATVVRATQPDGTGQFGRGIGVQPNPDTGKRGSLSLTASLIEANHDVGVFVGGSDATVEATVVRATKRAPAGLDFGDGILVMDDEEGESRVTIATTESTGNARAGVMYVGSTGELSGVLSSGNRFGLVLQPGASGAQPTLAEGNAFEGNTEKDKLVGGDLPVPDAVPPLP